MPLVSSSTGRLLLGVMCGFVLGIVLYQASGVRSGQNVFRAEVTPPTPPDACTVDSQCVIKNLGDAGGGNCTYQTQTCDTVSGRCGTTPKPCSCNYSDPVCSDCITQTMNLGSSLSSQYTLAEAQAHCYSVCCGSTTSTSASASQPLCCDGNQCVPYVITSSVGSMGSVASMTSFSASSAPQSCGDSLPECNGQCPTGKNCAWSDAEFGCTCS